VDTTPITGLAVHHSAGRHYLAVWLSRVERLRRHVLPPIRPQPKCWSSPVTAPKPEPPADEGGDPACWLPRVCPECGLLADLDPPVMCTRCGAEIPEVTP
ncbi:MAG: hypothetical protein ACRDQH_15920, partial [Pseudonocardiaceae bacterium]